MKLKPYKKMLITKKLKIRGGNNIDYDFSDYKTFKELFRDLYYKQITTDEVERKQDEFNEIIGVLEDYTPKANKYIEAKNHNVKKIYEWREKIIEGLKNGTFPFDYDEAYEEQMRYKKKKKKK